MRQNVPEPIFDEIVSETYSTEIIWITHIALHLQIAFEFKKKKNKILKNGQT